MKRSVIQVRERPHMDPARAGETIAEVIRNGEVVATIYGTREGVQVVTPYAPDNAPFLFATDGGCPSFVVPLLAPDETCPWCSDTGIFLDLPCPICAGRHREVSA